MQDFMTHLGSYGPLVISAVKVLAVLILGWMVAGIVSGVCVAASMQAHGSTRPSAISRPPS
jgi:hypothetical protein